MEEKRIVTYKGEKYEVKPVEFWYKERRPGSNVEFYYSQVKQALKGAGAVERKGNEGQEYPVCYQGSIRILFLAPCGRDEQELLYEGEPYRIVEHEDVYRYGLNESEDENEIPNFIRHAYYLHGVENKTMYIPCEQSFIVNERMLVLCRVKDPDEAATTETASE